MKLRAFQEKGLADLRRVFSDGARAAILLAPTGAGKTVMAAELCRKVVEKGNRALFLVPRRELGMQALEKLENCGLSYGNDVSLYMAGVRGADEIGSTAAVTIASKDTLTTRLRMGRIKQLPTADLVIVDEAHLSTSRTWLALLEHYLEAGARVVGLTATPGRKSGRGLGAIYERIVPTATVAELTKMGYLAPARYFAPSTPDLEKLRIVRGDFDKKELAERVNKPKHVGDVVAHYLEQGEARQAICFAVDRAHSIDLCSRFVALGVAARHVDGSLNMPEREGLMADYREGQFQVLTNCQIGTYGLDVPALSCVILARPTASLVLHLQMLGRGLRTDPGKSDCLIFDHAGNIARHGMVDAPNVWTLECGAEPAEPLRIEKGAKILELMQCSRCSALYQSQSLCPECGHTFKPRGQGVTWVNGQLVERACSHNDVDTLTRRCFYRELLGHCEMRSKKRGFAAHCFKSKYGDWPPSSWASDDPLSPQQSTVNYILSRRIAHAKAVHNK